MTPNTLVEELNTDTRAVLSSEPMKAKAIGSSDGHRRDSSLSVGPAEKGLRGSKLRPDKAQRTPMGWSGREGVNQSHYRPSAPKPLGGLAPARSTTEDCLHAVTSSKPS